MNVFSGEKWKLYHGNMLNVLDEIEPNSIDSIVTDPPYELNFMNKGWDNSGIAFQKETWEKCLKVLKPGGYLLAFGGSRTFHRIACAIEDAGFEIRDTVLWIYGSGFPKSMSISKGIEAKQKYGYANTTRKRMIEQACEGKEYTVKQPNNGVMGDIYEATRKEYSPTSTEAKRWNGWGTCLKPSYEPVIMARKPCEGTCVDNVLKYGVGGVNIDDCRVETSDMWHRKEAVTNTAAEYQRKNKSMYAEKSEGQMNDGGRFPANMILTYDDTDFEEVCGGFPVTKSNGGASTMPDFQDAGRKNTESGGINKIGYNPGESADRKTSGYINPKDSGSAARYFYCAKASKRDRDEGLSEFEVKTYGVSNQIQAEIKRGNTDFVSENDNPMNRVIARRNIHPTVKPTDLMQYLIRLVTPKGGTILDPFTGSGSTGKAAMYENKDRDSDYKFIGIELTEDYIPIAIGRIKFAESGGVDVEEEAADTGFEQMTIFDYLG